MLHPHVFTYILVVNPLGCLRVSPSHAVTLLSASKLGCSERWENVCRSQNEREPAECCLVNSSRGHEPAGKRPGAQFLGPAPPVFPTLSLPLSLHLLQAMAMSLPLSQQ
jgi:hypothetical protein